MTKRSDERERFLQDVVVCFIEDYGTNPWRQIEDYSYQYDGDATDMTSKMTHASATFIDVEDGQPDGGIASCPRYEVTIETVAKGLGKLRSGEVGMNSTMLGNILAGDTQNDAGLIDAYDADAIVQAGVFGDLVYG